MQKVPELTLYSAFKSLPHWYTLWILLRWGSVLAHWTRSWFSSWVTPTAGLSRVPLASTSKIRAARLRILVSKRLRLIVEMTKQFAFKWILKVLWWPKRGGQRGSMWILCSIHFSQSWPSAVVAGSCCINTYCQSKRRNYCNTLTVHFVRLGLSDGCVKPSFTDRGSVSERSERLPVSSASQEPTNALGALLMGLSDVAGQAPRKHIHRIPLLITWNVWMFTVTTFDDVPGMSMQVPGIWFCCFS